MKVLYLPLNSKDSVQQGMYDAWNELPFIDMKVFDFLNIYENEKIVNSVNEMFIKAVEEFQPNICAYAIANDKYNFS